MSEVAPDCIAPVLDALVGSTGINGETTIDVESMHNIGKLEAVCEWVCGRIDKAYEGSYPSQCASAEAVASTIRRASGFIPYRIGIDVDALLELADEMDAEKNFVLVGGYAKRIRDALVKFAS